MKKPSIAEVLGKGKAGTESDEEPLSDPAGSSLRLDAAQVVLDAFTSGNAAELADALDSYLSISKG